MGRFVLMVIALWAVLAGARADEAPLAFAISLNDPAAEIAASRALGASGVTIDTTWAGLEPRPGVYDLEPLANAIHAARGMTIFLNLRVIDTTRPALPNDLAARALNDRAVTQRFAELVRVLAPVLSRRVTYLALGADADIYLSPNPKARQDYLAFLADAKRALRQSLPEATLGVGVSLEGMDANRLSVISELIDWGDAAMVSFAPLGADFQLRPARDTSSLVTRLKALAGQKPLVLIDAAYPTSPHVNGSPGGQAEMIKALFRARKEIAFLGLAPAQDRAPGDCAAIARAHGAAGSSIYEDYWCSQGLVTQAGEAKPARALFPPARTP